MHDSQHDRIQERAYMIWLSEGRPHGRDLEHWRQAERQIADGAEEPSRSADAYSSGGKTSSQPAGGDTKAVAPQGQAEMGAEAAPRKPAAKRASRAKTLKEDPNAETQGRPSKKAAGDRAIEAPPRK